MATFNFEIKRQSYRIALEKTKELLANNDLENGIYFLRKAIILSNELISNCVVPELKEKFINENKKLKKLYKEIIGNNANKEKNNSNKTNDKKKTTLEKNNKSNNNSVSTLDTYYFKTQPPKTTLKDVAGLEEVKKQIKLNVLAPFKHPDLYKKYRDKMGCQILMYGPPGCGKTFIAEAIAGELKCAYAIVNAYEILDKYIGEGPKKIAQVFEEAKKFDKCLIFFDEIEALFPSRDSDESRYIKDILTTFLTCLSGFNEEEDKDKVRIVIGATNRPWTLDSALLRGKRLDTHIYVGLPDEAARRFLIQKIYKKHPNLLVNSNITIQQLVNVFKGYSCADIETILDKVNSEALLEALIQKEKGNDVEVPISIEGLKKVFSNYRNSITKESLIAFEKFKNGVI